MYAFQKPAPFTTYIKDQKEGDREKKETESTALRKQPYEAVTEGTKRR